MRASEIIEGARQLLPDEDSWIQGRAMTIEPGGWTRRCVSSALHYAAWSVGLSINRRFSIDECVPMLAAIRYVKQEAGTSGAIAAWNDDASTLYSDVQLVLKRAYHAALEAGD